MTRHNEVVRESFTTQAKAFAATPWVTDEERIRRLVSAAQVSGKERVLDIATGPGYVAEGFVHAAREVIGIDLTDAMLAIAATRAKQRGIANLSFRKGDAEDVPFDDEEFDVVVCRLALHHVREPLRVLSEMTRVCRTGGTVLVEDIFASEHPQRAAYRDRWEKLRDPSHVRTLPLSELLLLFRDTGLEMETVITALDLTPEVERWLATTKVEGEPAAEIRSLLEADRLQDLSGARPFHDEMGRLYFHARTVIVGGRKLPQGQGVGPTASRSKQST